MKVFTHYPALAPAIKRAGFEPVLLEPLIFERGPVRMERVRSGFEETIVVVHPMAPPIMFNRSTDHWEVIR